MIIIRRSYPSIYYYRPTIVRPTGGLHLWIPPRYSQRISQGLHYDDDDDAATQVVTNRADPSKETSLTTSSSKQDDVTIVNLRRRKQPTKSGIRKAMILDVPPQVETLDEKTIVSFDVPSGFEAKDLYLTVDGSLLRVLGKRHDNLTTVQFQRCLKLDRTKIDTEKISANFTDGKLVVECPRLPQNSSEEPNDHKAAKSPATSERIESKEVLPSSQDRQTSSTNSILATSAETENKPGNARPTVFLDVAPRFDQTKEKFMIVFDVPGFKAEDLEATVDHGILQVSGKRVDQDGSTQFKRVVILDDSRVDTQQLKADLNDGILTLVCPKRDVKPDINVTIATNASKPQENDVTTSMEDKTESNFRTMNEHVASSTVNDAY